jgi:hypothetical protein
VAEDVLPADAPPPRRDTAFDAIAEQADTHPWLALAGLTGLPAALGFWTGWLGYGDGSLLQGEVFAAILGIVGLVTGVRVVSRARRGTPNDRGSVVRTSSPTHRQAVRTPLSRFRNERLVRAVVACAFAVPGVVLLDLHAKVAGVLLVPGLVLLTTLKYRQWP